MSQKFYLLLLILLTFGLASESSMAQNPPSTQASYVSFSNVDETTMRISWINGNGGNRIVTITPAGSAVTNPDDATNYSENSNYGLSATISGSETRVVYDGSGRTRTVLVSGLTGSTSYTVKVFEYNYDGGQINYQTVDANNNPRGIKTAISAPSNITLDNIGAYSADVLWEGGNSNDMVLSLYDLDEDAYHIYYEEANIGDVSYGGGTSYSFTLQDLDLDGASHTFGVRIKAKDGADESAWYPANFTSSTFQTIEDATPPSFTYSIYTDNSVSSAASRTLTPGTYYVKVESSELLDDNPSITFTADADGGSGTDMDVSDETLSWTVDDQTWVYTLTIPTANYDNDNSVNDESTTFSVGGDDYALNSGTVTSIGDVGFTEYHIDNRPPADLTVTVPSGTFGINETVTATISLGGAETSATFGSMTFNGVDVADESNFEELGGGEYSVSYTVSESDDDTEWTTNWTSLSFSMIDQNGNSSTFIATATIGGSNTLTIDANSPTITEVILPDGPFAVTDVATVTFTVLAAGEWTDLTSGTFNGQELTNWTYEGGQYQNNQTSTYSADYTVTEGDLDLIDATGLTFSLVLTDQAGNESDEYDETNTTISNTANFDVDANSPVIDAVYLPSSTFGIGEVVTATFTMSEQDRDEVAYLYTSASINGVFVDGTDIHRVESSTSYTASYTVVEGDGDQIDVASEGTAGMRFVVEDAFGNGSNTVTVPEATGNITIDATRPVITEAWIPESGVGEYGIGSTFNIDVVFTESDDATSGSATFNSGTFTENNVESTATYSVVYTVGDGHPNIFNATEVPGTFTITDRAGNTSTITDVSATVTGGGQISIVGTKPEVTAIYVPAGTFTVGETLSVTFTVASNGANDLTDFATTFTLNGVELTLDGTDNLSSGSYSASYTITNGGTDVDGLSGGSASLTYQIQTSDTFGNESDLYSQDDLAATLATGDGSGEFILDANLPEISSVYIPSGNYKVGSEISATITTDSDIFGNYSLTGASASINNIEITDFTNLNSTSYSVTYTVGEGNTDRATLASIPTWFRVQDVHGNVSATFEDNLTSDGAVTIDANTPTIESVTIDGANPGEFGIGDVLTVRIESGESTASTAFNAPLESATITVNGAAVTNFTRLAPTSPTYTANYTVVEGHDDRASVGDIPISVIIKDPNGNISAEYTDAPDVSPGTGSEVIIDATKPVIDAVYLPSGTFNLDDMSTITVTFTVEDSGTLDDDNYTDNAHTFTINGYEVSTFDNLGSLSYSAVWTVEELQQDHNGVGSLTFNISTSDTFGNESLVYNSASITPAIVGGDGSFIVDANRPQIASATVSEGLHGIGLTIPITFEMVDEDDNTGTTIVNASSSFNGQPFVGAITGNNPYQLQYLIAEGHNEVATINDLSATITVMDKNGNSSLPTNPFWSPNTVFTVTNSGTFRIDGTRPTIDEVFVAGDDYGIGSTVTIVVTTTDNFNDELNLNSASFNLTSIPTERWTRNSNSYTTYYVVTEGDNEAYSTATQETTTFSISDESGNNNTTTTFNIDSDGEVAIDASSASITAIDFAGQTHKVDDVVSFTFTADYSNYTNDAHTFTVNGIEMVVANFNNIGSNSYTGTFTVSENDADVANVGALEFDIQTSDTFGNESDMYDENDITATGVGFSIDANSPTITNVVIESGNFKINDEISMTFTFNLNATDEGNTMALVPASSSFNGKALENFTKLSAESYAATYTVANMDTDVLDINDLSSTSITIQDIAGNISDVYDHESTSWTVDGDGPFSIDANAPVITGVFVDGGLFGFGETITATITVQDDEEGLSLYGASSSFNGHGVTGFTDNSGSYTVQYTVVENDDFIATLADLTNAATFTLIDDNLNISNLFTGAYQLGNGSTFSIDAVRPTITAATVPSNTFSIGQTFTATFTVDKNYIVGASGSINNETFTNATFVNDNYFTATYTVVEGNVDRTDGNQLPYSATITDEYGNESLAQNSNFDANASFEIDANRPYVDAITFEDGKYGIGSTLTATFTARTKANDGTIDGTQPLEAGLSLISASINSVDVSASFEDIGSGSYTLAYVVSEGDDDQEEIQTHEVEIVVVDEAGNESNHDNDYPRHVYSTGSTSIDATRPIINDIFVEASDITSQNNAHKIGDEVTVNVLADSDSFGGVAYTSGTISINGEDEAGTLSHNSGTYTFTYTVTEGNSDRTSLASTPMTYTLVDDHGNESVINTQLDATLSGTNFKIDANRPTFIVDYLFGHSKLTSPLVTDYDPYIATVDEPYTVRVTTNENVRYSSITPASLQATPKITIVAQGTNNNFTNTNLTYQGTVGGTTTFTIPVRTIAEDLGTDGTVSETVTATFTDLAGNTSTSNPTNAASRSFNIDATKPNFTFTYYTDAGFTTEIPEHGRLEAGTYHIKIVADELVKPLATFTIVNPEDNSFNVTEVFNAGVNTTTFSYEREISEATTVAGLTNETYAITSEDVIGNELISGSFTNSDTYLIYVDTQKPTATVTVAFENENADIITIDNPSATVTVIYDEDMDTDNGDPSVTFTTPSPSFTMPDITADGPGTWVTSRTYTRAYTHNLSEEILNNVSATVNTISGATDIAGNTDVGDSSPTFTVNTETAIASASISLYVFETENVINYDNRDVEVIVWYDRDMDDETTPSVTFSNNSNFAINGTPDESFWTGSRTWTATFTHSGTEYLADESATVSGSDVNGARDNVGNLGRGVESSTFRIDTELPTVSLNAPTSSNQNSATIGNSSVTFTYVVDYNDNDGLHAVSLSTNDITVNEVSGDVTSHSISVANDGINSSTVSIWAAEGDGYLSITIGEDVVTDLSGNGNTFSAESATIQIDNTAPEIVSYTFTYDLISENRDNFFKFNVSGADYEAMESTSFTLNHDGTAGGTFFEDVFSNTFGSVAFSGITGNGTVSVTALEGIASDIAGNITASYTTSTITVDNIAPAFVSGTFMNVDNTELKVIVTEPLSDEDDEVIPAYTAFSVSTGGDKQIKHQAINVFDKAIELNGSNQYVVYPDSEMEDDGLTEITIETWFKQETGTLQFITGKGLGLYEIHTYANSGTRNIRFIPTTGVYIDTDDNVFELGEWTHVACVYNPGSSLGKIYINGVEVNTTLSNGSLSTAIVDNDSDMNIGRRTDNSYYFDGAIDEFRFWNVARTAEQIASIYQGALKEYDDSELVMLERFDRNDYNYDDCDGPCDNPLEVDLGEDPALVYNSPNFIESHTNSTTTFSLYFDWDDGDFGEEQSVTVNADEEYDYAGNIFPFSNISIDVLHRPSATFVSQTSDYANSAKSVTITLDLFNVDSKLNAGNDDFVIIHDEDTDNGSITYLEGDADTDYLIVTGVTGNGSISFSMNADTYLSPEGYGNSSYTFTNSIQIDNINPIATIGNSSLTYTNSAGTFTYVVSYTDEDGGSGMTMSPLEEEDITFDLGNGITESSVSWSVTNNQPSSSTVSVWNVEGSGPLAIRVGADVAYDNAGNSNTMTGWSNTVTIDNTPPSATLTYTVNGTERTIGNDDKVVVISATFNEAMDENNNVELDIDVPGAGDIANAIMTRVSATSYTYTWEVNNGGDGATTFTFDGGTDLANNAIADGEENDYGEFALDNTAPTISSFSFTNADNTTAVVIFSENVYGDNTASGTYGQGAINYSNDLQVTTTGGTAQFAAPGGGTAHTPGSATFTFNNNVILNGPADGTENVEIEARTGISSGIYDFAGNIIDETVTVTTNLNKKATIQDAWIVNADDTYGIGSSITFNLEFDFVITDAASASMTLNNNGVATYAGGEGSKTISMVYEVSESDDSETDLVYANTTSISPADVFTDNRDFEVNQTLPATTVVTNDHEVIVDTERPTVTITSGPSPTNIGNNTATFTYVLTHSDNYGIDDISISTASITYDGITPGNSDVNTVGSSSTVTLWNISGDGYTAISINAGVVTDNAGNSSTATGFSNTITVDNTPPMITFTGASPSHINENGTATFTYTVTGAFANTANNTSSFTVVNTDGDGTIASTNPTVQSSGYVTVTNLDGDGVASITMLAGVYTDEAGNSSTATTSATINVDNTAPVVVINNPNPSVVNENGTTTFTLTITGADNHTASNDDFDLVFSGTAGGGVITYEGGDATSATVTVTGLTGDGSASLTIDADVYTDLAENGNVSGTSTTGVEVDNTAPEVTFTSSLPNFINSAGTATFTYVVNGADANTAMSSSFSVENNDGGGNVVNVSTTGNGSGTVTVTGLTGDGEAGIDILAGVYTDEAGNSNTLTSSATINVDNTKPDVTINAPSETLVNSSDTFTYVVDFTDENGLADLTIDGNDISFEGITPDNHSVTDDGSSATVTIWGAQGDGHLAISVGAGVATDDATNTNDATGYSATVTVDNTPPMITFTGASPSHINENGTATFTYTVSGAFANTANNTSSFTVVNTDGGGTVASANPTDQTSGYVTVTNLDGDGIASITMLAGVYTDEAGNSSTATTSATINVDNTPPTVVINNPNPSVVNENGTTTFTLTITGADNHTASSDDFDLVFAGTAGGGVITYEGGDATSATVTVTGLTGDGSASLTIDADVYTDLAENGNVSGTSTTGVEVDNTAPEVTFTSSLPNFINSAGTATFTYVVNGADANTAMSSSFSVENNGGVGNVVDVFTTGNVSGTVTVTGLTGDGEAGIDILAGVYTDEAGNSNTLTSSATINVDNTKPDVTINAPSETLVNSSDTFTYVVDFTDENGLADLTIDGNDISFEGITPDNHSVTDDGSSATVTIWGAQGDGHLAISVGAGVATDDATNTNDATGYSATVTVDNTPPMITFTGASPSHINENGTATFTYTVSGAFANTANNTSSFTVVNTDGGGTVASANPTDQTSGYVTVTNLDGDGVASITMLAGVYTDEAGNSSTATTSATINVDNTPPTVVINNPNPSVVNENGTTTFTLTITGADNHTASSDDFDLVFAGTAGGGDITYEGGDATSATVTVTGLTGDGSASLTIDADVYTDLAGNGNESGTSTTGVEVDNTAPEVTFTSSLPEFINSAGTATFTYVVNGADANTAMSSSFSVENNGGVGNVVDVFTTGNVSGTVTVTGLTGDGEAGIDILAGVYTDEAGNSNTLTSSATINVDNTKPDVTINAPSETLVNSSDTFTYVVDFTDENGLADLTIDGNDITFDGITPDNHSVTDDGSSATVTIWGAQGDGHLAISVGAGVATDDATNTNDETGYSATVTVDNTAPVITFNEVNPSVVNQFGTATFTYNVTGANINNVVDENDFTIEYGSGVATLVGSDLNSGTVTVTGLTGNGSASLTINLGSYEDNAGNLSIATTSGGITVDNTNPTLSNVTISTDNSTGNRAKVGDLVSLTFSSDEELSLDNSSVNIAGRMGEEVHHLGGTNYSTTISVLDTDTEGSVTFSISATDLAGNNVTDDVADAGAVTIDYSSPTGTITVVNNSTLNLSNSSLTVTVSYDENMKTSPTPNIGFLDNGSLTITSAGAGNWNVNDYTEVFNVSGNYELSNISATLSSNTAEDIVGNVESNVIIDNNTFDVDRVAPVATISTNEEDPTPNQLISATLTFSEDISGINVNDLLNTTNASATITSEITAGTVYGIQINAIVPGTVNVWLAANEANDNAGNPNSSSNTLSYEYQAIESYTDVALFSTSVSSNVTMISTGANRAFTLVLTDDAGAGTTGDGDELPTKFTGITIGKSGSYNFNDVINSATFFNNSGTSIGTGTVNSNNIVFNLAQQTIIDGESATFYMSYTTKASATFDIDNTELIFTVANNNMTVGTESTPFETVSLSTNNFASDYNVVNVTATKLIFTTQPQNHTLANGTSFVVKATDAGNNVDKNFNSQVRIVSTIGKATSQDSTKTPSNGVASFSSYKFKTFVSSTTIKARATGMTEATSSAFSIRANAPAKITSGIIKAVDNDEADIEWDPPYISTDNPHNVLILLKLDKYEEDLAFSNDIENSLNSTTFNSNLEIETANTAQDDNESGTSYVIYMGKGNKVDGNTRKIRFTDSQGRLSGYKTASVAIYTFGGDVNNINTQSYNTDQRGIRGYFPKELFSIDDEKVSKNLLFSVGNINPNPVRDEFNLEMTLNEPMNINIDLYSTAGERIGNLFNNSLEIGGNLLRMDVSKFEISQGTYILQIVAGDEIMVLPFVIQK